MSKKKLILAKALILFFFFSQPINSQEDIPTSKLFNESFDREVRGANAFMGSIGSSVMNGDLENPMFDVYFHVGYKRYLSPNLNLNLSYHKFNLVYEDQLNEGFMSFDLNFEYDISPSGSVNPFIFAGGGLNAPNYFPRTDLKVQGGGGIEVLVSPQVGIRLFTDYNHVFSDELDGVVGGEADDIYWRMGFGLNFYFGKHLHSRRIAKNTPTVIKSNPVVDDY